MGNGPAKLTHLCISDLHAGSFTSLTTRLDQKLDWVPDKPSDTSITFGAALNATLASLNMGQPDLVMLGDALDLSLSPPARSCAVLRGFLEQIYGRGSQLTGMMHFVPGNHDHSIWTAERHMREVFKPGGATVLDGLQHTSPAFAKPAEMTQSRLLNQVAEGLSMQISTPTYYPNLGLTSGDGARAVVFHHGHFIEATYRLMSNLVTVLSGRKPGLMSVEDLERFNGSWIDFGWSTIGDDGALGSDTSVAYQYLLTGGQTDRFQRRIAEVLAVKLKELLPLPHTSQIESGLKMLAIGLVDAVIGKFSQLERFNYTEYLSPDSIQGLKAYLSGAVLPQMRAELGKLLPEETTFIFGHTHKPFEDMVVADGFERPVAVYNTGGWILDTSLLSTVEGASAVFVDADRNVAALRLFGTPLNGEKTSVYAVSANTIKGATNPLLDALNAALTRNSALWDAFSEAVKCDMEQRQKKVIRMTWDADANVKQHGGLV